MSTGILIAVGFMVVAALVATIGMVVARRDVRLVREELKQAQTDALDQREERNRVEQELAAVRAASATEIASLKARAEEVRTEERKRREEEIEHLKSHFRNLSTEILGEQSRQFRETNRESLDVLLKPFQENITEFRKRIEEIHRSENVQHGELKNELKNLMELNQKITTEATNLTNALRGDSKRQGDWGEMLLETILENSSLVKNLHYEIQKSVKNEEGREERPDVVLMLPEGKRIVIDSKVSLKAYDNYHRATDKEEKEAHLKAHVDSVRKHIKELSDKEYQKLFLSPDFVIMFVAPEPAFLEAVKADPELWNEAYKKKVIISSPTNLFALLKMVADMWKRDAQEKNTQKIAELGLKLYEKAVLFTEALEEVGSSLQRAQKAYDQAQTRLSGKGSLVSFGEQLKKTARLQSKKEFSPALQEENEA